MSHPVCDEELERAVERIESDAVANAVYIENGFANRSKYLDSLREEYGAHVVDALIGALPASEDFDALPTMLDDYADAEHDQAVS